MDRGEQSRSLRPSGRTAPQRSRSVPWAIVLAILIAPWWTSHVAADRPTATLIYYANESSNHFRESRNIATLLRWLDAMELGAAAASYRSITDDMRLFAASVDDEIAGIRAGAPLDVAVAIIRNTTVLKGNYLAKPAGESTFVEVPTPESALPDDIRFESNPLSHGRTFRLVLSDAIGRLHRPGATLHLVVKSHGDDEFAVMPRTSIDTTRTSFEQIREFLNDFEAGRADRDSPPAWLAGTGIRKAEFLSALDAISLDAGAQFDLVFLEACEATVGLWHASDRPAAVGAMEPRHQIRAFASAGPDPIDYRNLDYRGLFERFAGSPDLTEAFMTEILSKGLLVQRLSDD